MHGKTWVAAVLLACAACTTPPPGSGSGPATSPGAATNQDAALRARVAQWFASRMPTDSSDSAMANSGQYMRHGCRPASDVAPEWQGFPVRRCDYTHAEYGIPVSTTAYLLFPEPDKLAEWIVNACKDGAAANLQLCTGQLTLAVWKASGAQFPVAGYVVEPASVLGTPQNPGQPYCFLFRNGVTVTTASWPDTRMHVNQKCGPETAMTDPVVKAFNGGARVASTTRTEYRAALQATNPAERQRRAAYIIGTDYSRGSATMVGSPGWADTTGKEFREAWRSDRNFLLYAKVVSGSLAGTESAF